MKSKKYSKKIAEIIRGFLETDDWNYTFDENRGTFKFGLNLHCRLKRINFLVRVKEDSYLVCALSPIGADEDDEETKMRLAEFFCRANYGLSSGNFEFDMRDSEIRFKCFVDCDGIVPTAGIVKNSIYVPVFMFERYGNGILDIVFRGTSAKEAIEKCENPSADTDPTASDEGTENASEEDSLAARLASRLGMSPNRPQSLDEQSASESSETST